MADTWDRILLVLPCPGEIVTSRGAEAEAVSKLVMGVFPSISRRPGFTVRTAGQTIEKATSPYTGLGPGHRKAGLQYRYIIHIYIYIYFICIHR